jgi:hypothetical protein
MTPIVIPWRPAQRADDGDALAKLAQDSEAIDKPIDAPW